MNRIGKNMVARYEQVELFSSGEYERRIAALREEMARTDVDVVLFPECAEEAYDQWLTGRRMLDCVVVPARGEVLGIFSAEYPLITGSEEPDFSRHLRQKETPPPCDGVCFCGPLTPRRLAERIAAGDPRRFGIVLPDHMPAVLAEELERLLPLAETVDFTLPAALVRAVKSPEEWAAIHEARNIQVEVYDAMAQIIRPGRNMRDISAEIHYLLADLGAANVVHAHLYCDAGQNTPSYMHKYDDRTVEWGDRFFALMETNGPGGQHVCFGRCMTLGEPTPGLVRAYGAAERLHKFAVAQMKPGETLAAIAVRTRKFANEMGYDMRERLGWNWMHSMGGYYYEQYSLEDYTESVPLREDIMLHCHPVIYRTFPELDPYVREEDFLLNAYHITKDGVEDVIDVPFAIRVLG